MGVKTAVIDNSAAFGFSIMITSSFGALDKLAGSPSLADIFGFAMGAAAAFTVLQAATTKGFRRRPGAGPREVDLLGTALGILSVALGRHGLHARPGPADHARGPARTPAG